VGGGALFFALQPRRAVIADSNPELIHFYETLRDDPKGIIRAAHEWDTDRGTFYLVRALDPTSLPAAARAARSLYLNRTCFNGLYRVNARGAFNVPYGSYVNPRIVDEAALHAASNALCRATIVCGDYRDVLKTWARSGDFIFLDPPYAEVSRYSDFKRYTRRQFRAEDHATLAQEVNRLKRLRCSMLVMNSNVPLVRTLYAGFSHHVVQSRRSINCDGRKRTGQDLIIRCASA